MTPKDVVNLVDNNGGTALFEAVVVGNVEGAKMLVYKNSDLPNKPDKYGIITPLHFAAMCGFRKMVLYLKEVTRPDILFANDYAVRQRLHFMIWDVAEKLVPHVKRIREKKERQHHALELVKFLCMEVAKSNLSKVESIFKPALRKAVRVGIPEIVEEIVLSYPSALFFMDLGGLNIFKYAILYRRERVFNLIYQTDHVGKRFILGEDYSLNNGLHLVARLTHEQQINLKASAAGAVLQMQREVQWFKFSCIAFHSQTHTRVYLYTSMESSSNVNCTSSPREKWPYPTSEINVLDIVPKLSSERNYDNWRLSMRDFIRMRGLIGFIEDAAAVGESNRDEAWNGSNNLVRGWILATLSEDIRSRVLRRYETGIAKDLWTELEKIFDATRLLWQLDERTEYRQAHYNLALHKAAINGDWDKAMVIIELEPDAVRTPITPFSQTALSVAISSASAGRNLFVRELLEKMTPQDVVDLSNNQGATALHYAASIDNMEGARMLVNKNPDLPNVPDKSGETPLHYAAKYGNREMVLYLNKVTREDILLDLANGRKGASLLVCFLTRSELYEDDFAVPPVKSIRKEKLRHHHALELVKFLCKEVAKSKLSKVERIFKPALRKAARVGIPEIIEEIVLSYPFALSFINLDNVNIIKYAILYRRERVFNLIHQLGWKYIYGEDNSLNNVLHLAAHLRREQQINLKDSAAGAVLQMQREMQWFKATSSRFSSLASFLSPAEPHNGITWKFPVLEILISRKSDAIQYKYVLSLSLSLSLKLKDLHVRADEEKEYRQGNYLALHKAAVNGDWDKAIGIIEDDPDAVTTPITPFDQAALHLAVSSASAGRNRFVRELLEKMTPEDVVDLVDDQGGTALHYAADVNNIEGAKLLVSKNSDLPDVVDQYGYTPLHWAANFRNREMVLYLKDVTGEEFLSAGDLGPKLLSFLTRAEIYVPHVKRIREKRERQHHALELVKFLCMEVAKSKLSEVEKIFKPALRKAACIGIPEIVEEIVVSYPSALFFVNLDNLNIFIYAIMYRREHVFNLIYQIDGSWRYIYGVDNSLNNGLHLAARLRPEQQINLKASVAGAVLQMQREMQWFKVSFPFSTM
ncbi:hypothetical protein RHGRI_006715 [Rhododendron griersonianum]|uniref:Uncharacterized protein n=1 Tax=Rhododendron griersonianum TaxID=479676 RepID=A0AAV6KVJ6_9ERIC|nr:hypothetical protein RHGRI_006715 [Rhododendron griersonianum]